MKPPVLGSPRGWINAMTPVGKYLYAIIRSLGEPTFDDVLAVGDPHIKVHTLSWDGLAAVVSDSPLTEYPSNRSYMLAHQRVQERVLREFTLLPVRFGTVATGTSPEKDIQKLLQKRVREFDALLADLEGHVELGLKALWRDERLLFEEILSENPSIQRLRDSLAGKPSHATQFDRIRLGEMIKDALGLKKAGEAAGIVTPLRRLARSCVEKPVVLERMIVNAAFLVDKAREGEFDQAVAKLDVERCEMVIKYVGPIPPYNFVNIAVNWQAL